MVTGMASTRTPPGPPRIRQQSGAFDLPSVLIGVAVVAILAVGVMAAVFGVIPGAQDRAAMQDLAAVNTAQGTMYVNGGGFTDKKALVTAGWIGEGTPEALEARSGADGKCYVAVTTSKTGKRFIVSSDKPTPHPLANEDIWCTGALITPDPDPVMISTWNTSLAPNCREITLPASGFRGSVSWGDGASDSKLTHAYAKAGEITIRIDGKFSAWGAAAWEDSNCLVSVDRWGSTGTTSLKYAFDNADNLRHVEQIPPTTVNLGYAFNGVDSAFTLGPLDTARVTSMFAMFMDATAFNQPVSLDTGQVADMAHMFNGASSFNQPLSLDTSSVLTMYRMFYAAGSFNQPLSFDTSKVSRFGNMFFGASSFNQPLRFDTSSATSMIDMFKNAAAFNRPLDFDTSNVTDMFQMFFGASSFNQPLAFDTSKVTDMTRMFHEAVAFNQDLSGWNVSAVTPEYRISFSNGAISWKLPKPAWTS